MGYIAAVVFGAGIGIIFGLSQARRQRLADAATTAVALVGIGYAIWGPGSIPAYGVIIALTCGIAALLMGGIVWKTHPLLAGSGYWSRVWIASVHRSTLRHVEADQLSEPSVVGHPTR